MEIYVIRHTQVASKGLCYGQSDVVLAESFLEEAEAIRAELPTDFDRVYSSPTERCRQLSEALNLGTVEYERKLMEMNFGDWEGKAWNELDQESLNIWMNDFVNTQPPNAESLSIVYKRVATFMEHLRKEKFSKVLLVTHAGVIRCLWAYLLGVPLHNIFKLPVGYQEVLIFSLNEDISFDRMIRIK